jgi:hypothetical protein
VENRALPSPAIGYGQRLPEAFQSSTIISASCRRRWIIPVDPRLWLQAADREDRIIQNQIGVCLKQTGSSHSRDTHGQYLSTGASVRNICKQRDVGEHNMDDFEFACLVESRASPSDEYLLKHRTNLNRQSSLPASEYSFTTVSPLQHAVAASPR